MTGQLAIRAPHLDGTEPVGTWAAIAWAVYVDLLASGYTPDSLDEAWQQLCEPLHAQDDGPTMETWGADEDAQAAQYAFMRSVMGAGVGGAADGSMFGAMGTDPDGGGE